MSSVQRSRVRRGLSTGGQFATEHKPESPMALGAPAQAAAPAPVVEYQAAQRGYEDATEVNEVTSYLHANYPQAVAFAPTFDSDDAALQYRTADGSTDWVEIDDETPMFTGAGNKLAGRLADEKGWITIADANAECSRAAIRLYVAGQAIAPEAATD